MIKTYLLIDLQNRQPAPDRGLTTAVAGASRCTIFLAALPCLRALVMPQSLRAGVPSTTASDWR